MESNKERVSSITKMGMEVFRDIVERITEESMEKIRDIINNYYPDVDEVNHTAVYMFVVANLSAIGSVISSKLTGNKLEETLEHHSDMVVHYVNLMLKEMQE